MHKVFCSFENADGTNCTNEATRVMRRYYGVIYENNPLRPPEYADLPICDSHRRSELDKPDTDVVE